MYTWNKQELELKRKLALLLRKPEYAKHYELILNQLNLTDELFKPSDIMVNNRPSIIDYYESLSRFSTGLEYLSEDTYMAMAEIFLMIEDHNAFNKKEELNPHFLTDSALIGLVRDMIESFHIKEFNSIYDKISNPTQHRLNIQKNDLSYTAGTLEYVGGITLNDPLFNKSYINIFRNYTIEDAEVLLHEVMHAIYYSLMRPIYTKNKNNIYLLQELEGQFGSLYAYEYLSKQGFTQEMDRLKREYIDGLITSSFLFIVNHVLFATSSNQEFNLDKAMQQINEQLKRPISLSFEELPTYLTLNGLETLTTMISSLIALEILDKDISLQDKVELLTEIKASDSLDLDKNLDKYGVNFKENNFKVLRKTYQELHQ